MTNANESIYEYRPELRQGYFLGKLVPGGVEVAFYVWLGPPLDPVTLEPLDRSWRWQVAINGEPVLDQGLYSDRDAYTAGPMIWRAVGCREITEQTYREYSERFAWVKEHRPGLPEAHPERPVRLTDQPSLF